MAETQERNLEQEQVRSQEEQSIRSRRWTDLPCRELPNSFCGREVSTAHLTCRLLTLIPPDFSAQAWPSDGRERTVARACAACVETVAQGSLARTKKQLQALRESLSAVPPCPHAGAHTGFCEMPTVAGRHRAPPSLASLGLPRRGGCPGFLGR